MAVGPCAFAYLAPMLVIAMKAATVNPYMGLIMVMMYALGNCTVLVVAGTSAGFVSGFMKLDEKARFTLVMNHLFGIILILIGLLLIYKAP
jgi:cytochrome c-type biogenesis protein